MATQQGRGDGIDAIRCLREAPNRSDFSTSVEIAELTPSILVLLERTGYFCGGAYPDWYTKSYTWNRNTQRWVETEGFIVWSNPGGGKPDISWRPLNDLLLERYCHAESDASASGPERSSEDGGESCCATSRDIMPLWPAWFSRQGVHVHADFPHVAGACETEFLVSYEEFAPYFSLAGSEAIRRWYVLPIQRR